MGNRQRIDNDFIPCPVKPDDELFTLGNFVFNITSMMEFIENNQDKFILEDIPVSNFYSSFAKINEDHVDVVDISRPILLIEISPGEFTLIDGNHRMEKARRSGLKNLRHTD